tara:strand:+ start:468 stop:704 length:237 start_codon:yes stop_codon:yes gene_type:complete
LLIVKIDHVKNRQIEILKGLKKIRNDLNISKDVRAVHPIAKTVIKNEIIGLRSVKTITKIREEKMLAIYSIAKTIFFL